MLVRALKLFAGSTRAVSFWRFKFRLASCYNSKLTYCKNFRKIGWFLGHFAGNIKSAKKERNWNTPSLYFHIGKNSFLRLVLVTLEYFRHDFLLLFVYTYKYIYICLFSLKHTDPGFCLWPSVGPTPTDPRCPARKLVLRPRKIRRIIT